MTVNDLATVTQFVVRRQCIHETLMSLREFGRLACEGLVLWLGEVDESKAYILSAFTPPQNPIQSEAGVGYFVTGETLFHLNRSLAEHHLRLIAQVHSHPGEAYHSSTDDAYPIVTTQGGLSLVVPNFGDAPADPSAWATYRLMGSRWEELSPSDVTRLIAVIDA